MKKGFLAFAFLLSLCLVGCSTKMPPVEERLPVTESKVQNFENSVVQEPVEENEGREIWTKSILQVQSDTRLGSGVLWEKREEEWIVVTAAHVVEGLQETDVYLVPEDKILPARVWVVNGLDLAFLTVSISSLEETVESKYSPVGLVDSSVEEGIAVYTKGYNPYGELCEFSGKVLEDWIYVEDFDNFMLVCDCQADPGMSGGAVITEKGCLLGLICGENEQGMLAALPIGVIQNEYKLFRKD